jgi:hypothetical protein
MAPLLRCALLFGAVALFPSSAGAQWAPWCLFETGNRGSGGSSCTFHSYEQCQVSRSGIGGYCTPNPFLSYGSPRPGEARPQRRYRRE